LATIFRHGGRFEARIESQNGGDRANNRTRGYEVRAGTNGGQGRQPEERNGGTHEEPKRGTHLAKRPAIGTKQNQRARAKTRRKEKSKSGESGYFTTKNQQFHHRPSATGDFSLERYEGELRSLG
jgi:hypothetical protein